MSTNWGPGVSCKGQGEIAARGLVVTVVQNFYGLIAAQRKYANVQQAAAEADRFLQLSRKLESGGEVAHSDVIKAQLQLFISQLPQHLPDEVLGLKLEQRFSRSKLNRILRHAR